MCARVDSHKRGRDALSHVHERHPAPWWLHADRFAAHIRSRHPSPPHLHAPRMHAPRMRPAERRKRLELGRVDHHLQAPRRALATPARQMSERWSDVEMMSLSPVAARFGSIATQSSSREQCAPLSEELAGLLTHGYLRRRSVAPRFWHLWRLQLSKLSDDPRFFLLGPSARWSASTWAAWRPRHRPFRRRACGRTVATRFRLRRVPYARRIRG